MSFSAREGRIQLLSELARATGALGAAASALGDAYEWLDEASADRMEATLFRPVQAAYGRAQRTHHEFARRSELPAATFARPGSVGHPGDARGALERAAGAVAEADGILATLQDSLLPVEVGDAELRAGLTAIRDGIAPLPGRTRELLRTFGR